MFLTPWLKTVQSKLNGKTRSGARDTRRKSGRRNNLQGVSSQVERMEDRTLLAVTSIFQPTTGTLLIGADTDEDIIVTSVAGSVLIDDGSGPANPQTGPLAAADVRHIEIVGGEGDNLIDLGGMNVAEFILLNNNIEVDGEDGADVIIASDLGGTYDGGHGDDVLTGGAGSDTMNGDDGDDTLSGGSANDWLVGDDGDDFIDAGLGDDTVDAGHGLDTVDGGSGNDSILGGDDADVLNGSGGNDTINGGFGGDTIDGGLGNDDLLGGAHDDLMNGGIGNDRLRGNGGADTLQGGMGADSCDGGTGDDFVDGEDGDDSLHGDDGNDSVLGGDGSDTLSGDDGMDTLNGEDGNDLLFGGLGADSIEGGLGDDTGFGQAGDDELRGGGGADSLDGGAGNDFVQTLRPGFTITDAVVGEGDNGLLNAILTVNFATVEPMAAQVDFQTRDGLGMNPGVDGKDYIGTSGTINFAPGEVMKTIAIPIIGNTFDEPNRSFFVDLVNSDGPPIVDGEGEVFILDDDDPPVLSIDDFTMDEGDAGTTAFTFSVSLSAPSNNIVTVEYATTDGTASAPSDYSSVGPMTLTFPAQNTTPQIITVLVSGDLTPEADETFFVNLFNPENATISDSQGVGTILNEEAVGPGINFTGTTQLDTGGAPRVFPPDIAGSVGPTHIVEFVRSAFRVYDKAPPNNRPVDVTDLDFWNNTVMGVTVATNADLQSPRVIYDHDSGRWFAAESNDQNNTILLAVSETSDPTGNWNGTVIPIPSPPGFNVVADFLTMGLDADGVYLSVHDLGDNNPAGGTFPPNERIFSVRKSDLLLPVPDFSSLMQFPVAANRDDWMIRGFTVQPAINFDPSDGSASLLATAPEANPMRLVQSVIRDPAGTPVLEDAQNVGLPFTYQGPPNANQLPGVLDLEIGDARFASHVVEFGGNLWAVQNVDDPGGTGNVAVRWYRINPFTSVVLESGVIADAALDFSLPSIAVNQSGSQPHNIVIGFTASSATTPPSSYAVTGTFNPISGITTFADPPFELQPGNGTYERTMGGAGQPNLWGRYSTTVPDPSDPLRFWTFQEFVNAQNDWGVQITEIIFAPPTPAGLREISIQDATLRPEGDSATTELVFTVSLSASSTQAITVQFATQDGPPSNGATAGNDYVAQTGIVTFAPGTTTQQIRVEVMGDLIREEVETFFVNLTSPSSNARIADIQAIGTIVDDDTRVVGPGAGEADTLFGGDGADTLLGDDAANLIVGGPGNDSIDGFLGDDILEGAAGNDTLTGGQGNDLLDGGQGSDTLIGDLGNDTIAWETGDGYDEVDGGFGFDEIHMRTMTHNDRFTVGADGSRLSVVHRLPGDPVGQRVRGVGVEVLDISSNGGADRVTIEDLTPVANLQQVNVDLGNGSDLLDASAQVDVRKMLFITGGGGSDTVIGGAGADSVDGGASNDSISGGGGADTLRGGDGVDRLFGGSGNDVLLGEGTRDLLFGEEGDDTLDGGLGNDDLSGGTGNDSLLGSLGDDSLLGEAGHDSLEGGSGDDTLRGDQGNDTLLGGDGVDSLAGGDDNDSMLGGNDGDTLAGGMGDDTMFGGNGMVTAELNGNDFLNGNAGNDSLHGEQGRDTMFGGAGQDTMDGDFGDDRLNGNAGDDSVLGGQGDDTLNGAMGNDTLNGGNGEDKLFGQAGNDALSGEDGSDRVNGGGGADTLHGGDGDDTLRGGAGVDLLIGHDGADNLDGQGGAPDTLVGGDSFDILNDNGGEDEIDNNFVFFAEWIDAT